MIGEAAALGVLQIGFSGGEPLARRDLPELVRAAREANLYSNLITSGIGLDDERVRALRDAGLDSVQLSFQSDDADLADEIAGAPRAPAQARCRCRTFAQQESRSASILSFTGATSIACRK